MKVSRIFLIKNYLSSRNILQNSHKIPMELPSMGEHHNIPFDGLKYWEIYSILYATNTALIFLTSFLL
jgi:hypothetical protein